MHVDSTARLQTVSRDDNPSYYDLIKTFQALTAVPMLLNTSFNGNNEPRLESTADALKFFERSKVDALVVGDKMILKG